MNIRVKPVLAVDYQTISEQNEAQHYHQSILPEHRLLWAMLERAVLDAIGREYVPDGAANIMQDAYCWIMYPRWLKEFHEFSFESICQELDMNPLIIRKFVATQCRKPKEERIKKKKKANTVNNYKLRN